MSTARMPKSLATRRLTHLPRNVNAADLSPRVDFEGVGHAVAYEYVVEHGHEGIAQGHGHGSRHGVSGIDIA